MHFWKEALASLDPPDPVLAKLVRVLLDRRLASRAIARLPPLLSRLWVRVGQTDVWFLFVTELLNKKGAGMLLDDDWLVLRANPF